MRIHASAGISLLSNIWRLTSDNIIRGLTQKSPG